MERGISALTIRDEIIQDQIRIITRSVNHWRIAETCVSVIAELSSVSSVLLAFSVSYFNNSLLAYLSGTSGASSIGLRQFSAYCFRQGQAQSVLLNNLLTANGELPIPEVLTAPQTITRHIHP